MTASSDAIFGHFLRRNSNLNHRQKLQRPGAIDGDCCLVGARNKSEIEGMDCKPTDFIFL